MTYHSFCGSTNVLGLHEPPRRIIAGLLGCDLREMEEAGVCCGFGGSFSADHPSVSRLVAERKMANIDAAGAPVVVTDNPGASRTCAGRCTPRGGRSRLSTWRS